MSEQHVREQITSIVHDYRSMVRRELNERWEAWQQDLDNREMNEVIGSLLARLVTLSIELAQAPTIWNGHIAPLILRAMADVSINLAWIFDDPAARARKFVMYGLGQEKLLIEHYNVYQQTEGVDADIEVLLAEKQHWLETQRSSTITEVNVGSWTGFDTRKIAEEAGCLDLYRFAYVPFSAAIHSTWPHISRYNLAVCLEPLHGSHKIPVIPEFYPDIDYLYRAAMYVQEAFDLFDQKTGISIKAPSAFDELVKELASLAEPEQGESSSTSQND